VVLNTADHLDLIGELSLPADRPPTATVVLLHPLPTHGGMMDSHLYRKAAWRLPALASLAVLRFNTRGTASEAGRSGGEFDNGDGERLDVEAALDFTRDLPNVWLVGWSFGTDLALMHGCAPQVRGAVLISPPLRWSRPAQLRAWERSGKPVVCLVPEHDDYLPPPEARARFGEHLPSAEVVEFANARHLMVGHSDKVLDAIVTVVAPDVPTPLPRTWSGPSEKRQVAIVER
jgi:alpha/beta superfamily hydrolase